MPFPPGGSTNVLLHLIQPRLAKQLGQAVVMVIDYSIKRWHALTRFLEDSDLPIDNNWVENRIRPIAFGR